MGVSRPLSFFGMLMIFYGGELYYVLSLFFSRINCGGHSSMTPTQKMKTWILVGKWRCKIALHLFLRILHVEYDLVVTQ